MSDSRSGPPRRPSTAASRARCAARRCRWRSDPSGPVARCAGPAVAPLPAAFTRRARAAGELRWRQARFRRRCPGVARQIAARRARSCSTRPDPSGWMRPNSSSRRRPAPLHPHPCRRPGRPNRCRRPHAKRCRPPWRRSKDPDQPGRRMRTDVPAGRSAKLVCVTRDASATGHANGRKPLKSLTSR